MLVALLKAVPVRDKVLRDVADKFPPPRPVDEMIHRENVCPLSSLRFCLVLRVVLMLVLSGKILGLHRDNGRDRGLERRRRGVQRVQGARSQSVQHVHGAPGADRARQALL